MDLSYWAKFNPKVAFEHTQKQFFSKYVLRVTYNISCASYINKAGDKTMADYIEWRKVQAKIRNGGYGYNHYWTYGLTDKTDPAILEHFRVLKGKYELKYRLEADNFSIYSNDEADLKKFNDAIDPHYQCVLHEISCPKDAAHQKLLESGHITSANKKGYKYKVMLRDGQYDANAKQQLLNYFDSLGDAVTVGKATRRSLSNGHKYTWGNYIHTSDPTILSFVDLIVPGIVGKTHEITKI